MKYLFIILSFVSLLLFSGCASKGEVIYALESPEAKENVPGGSLKEQSENALSGNAQTESGEYGSVNPRADRSEIYIAVLGEVNNPGIYVKEAGTRVFEVINEAGGTTGFADLTHMDLVAFLNEDCTLIIPGTDPAGSKAAGDPAAGDTLIPAKLLININTAGREELMTLKGIGATRAEAIIEYRNTNGSFEKPEDLTKVSGIGEATYGRLKDSITTD